MMEDFAEEDLVLPRDKLEADNDAERTEAKERGEERRDGVFAWKEETAGGNSVIN